MYRQNPFQPTSLSVNQETDGEPIEATVRRILNNKEPIPINVMPLYTERKDGVNPNYNIRHDWRETAVEQMDAAHKSDLLKRQNRIDDREAQKEGFKDAADKKEQMEKTKNGGQTNDNQ